MNISLGFFDIDGTLIRRNRQDGLSLKSRSFNYAIETVFDLENIDYTAMLGKRIYGLTDKKVLKLTLSELGISVRQYRENEEELFAAVNEYFEKHRSKNGIPDYVPLTGISEFLELLRSRNVRLGLMTGNIKTHSHWKLTEAGFDGFFTTGAYGEDAENRDEILSIAIERNADIPVSQICHFGDSPLDLEAARMCNVRGIVVSDKGGGTHSVEELETIGYGLVIDTWKDLKAIEEYLS
jgi:phosphoglycolate phosphatase-like HAD superfamily hydrolase